MTAPRRPAVISRDEYRAQVAREMSEATLLARVRGLARELGYLTYHTHDSRRSEPGYPDLHLVSEGRRRHLYAELKTQAGRLTIAQRTWLAALELAGAEVHVWRPADLLNETILNTLKECRRA